MRSRSHWACRNLAARCRNLAARCRRSAATRGSTQRAGALGRGRQPRRRGCTAPRPTPRASRLVVRRLRWRPDKPRDPPSRCRAGKPVSRGLPNLGAHLPTDRRRFPKPHPRSPNRHALRSRHWAWRFQARRRAFRGSPAIACECRRRFGGHRVTHPTAQERFGKPLARGSKLTSEVWQTSPLWFRGPRPVPARCFARFQDGAREPRDCVEAMRRRTTEASSRPQLSARARSRT